MWESSFSSVTGVFPVSAFAGTFQLLRNLLMSPSSESLPSSTRASAPIAETGLLIEAAWKSVDVVTGCFASASASP